MVEDLDLSKLKPNTLIEGPMWNGPVRFLSMMGDTGNRQIIIQSGDTPQIIPVQDTGHGIRLVNRRGEPWRAFMAVEQLRHEYARNLGMPGSADQLPHQLKTIYQVSGETGRIRHMIADEPGGGKTVVASRIIQELHIQKQVQHVLIVVPAPLKYQWQKELKRFVGMDSHIVEGGTQGHTNPWLSDDKPILITSMDYAKQGNQRSMLEQARFDLVVVDEAHNLNSTGKSVTTRYKLGELFDKISKHMLFLTATPHRGKPENFRLLLKLLEPDLFSNPKMTPGDVYNTKDRLFIRYAKSDMVGMNGEKLFQNREVKSVKYKMSPTEWTLYNRVTRYVEQQYNIQMGRDANQISTFAVLIIQRRMASSTHALLESLKRRRHRLGNLLENWDGPVDDYTVDDADDLDEDELENMEAEAAGHTLAQTADELEDETNELDELIKMAEHTAKTKPDTKLERLISEIYGIGSDKLLIFSEYRDTLDYLQENIAKMRRADGSGYTVCRIDGTMNMADREVAQTTFRNSAQIMLATDAAREGINLQFCHRMINYDLPWTPISLEQRMGRLHRYGQEEEVVISNMVADGTREGHVMDTLFEKIRQIEIQYPTFNVMGQVLAGGDLKGLMTDAIRSGSTDGITDQVKEAAERAKKVDEMLGRTPLVVRDVRRRMESVEAQHTDGEYLVKMMERLFEGLGGSIRYSKKKTRLVVPTKIQSGPFTKKHNTYDMSPAELFARGGSVYNHLAEWIRTHCSNDLKFGSVLRDPDGFDGHIIFHTAQIFDKGGEPAGRLLTAHKYADGVVASVEPYILHDMKYDGESEAGPAPRTNDVQKAARDVAQAEANVIAAERKKYWDHRTKTALARMQAEVEDIRMEMGMTGFGDERNAMAARRDELERNMADMKTKHQTATTLTPRAPTLEGWVRVIPDGPRDGQHTERIGMDASMSHERSEGFTVQDVSARRGIGFDVLSTHEDGRRREIEVKARCGMADVDFTEAEYEHIQQSDHAVIHVISNAGRPDQRFDIISNPRSMQATRKTMYGVSRTEIRRLVNAV